MKRIKKFIKDHGVFAIPLIISMVVSGVLMLIWFLFKPYPKIVFVVPYLIMLVLYYLDFASTSKRIDKRYGVNFKEKKLKLKKGRK